MRVETPTLTSLIGCSTETATNTAQPDQSGTPIRGQEANTASTEQKSAGKPGSKLKFEVEKNQSKTELEPRRSKKIETAKKDSKGQVRRS